MAGLFPERSGVSWSANKFFLPPSSHHPALGRSLALEKEGLAEREERVEELSGDSPPTIPLLISSLLFLRRLLIAPVTLGEPLLSCLAATRTEEHAEPDVSPKVFNLYSETSGGAGDFFTSQKPSKTLATH